MQPFQDSTETLGDKTKGLWIWPVGTLDGRGIQPAEESGRQGGLRRARGIQPAEESGRHSGFGRSGRDLAGGAGFGRPGEYS